VRVLARAAYNSGPVMRTVLVATQSWEEW
jgi:hypothetical protein